MFVGEISSKSVVFTPVVCVVLPEELICFFLSSLETGFSNFLSGLERIRRLCDKPVVQLLIQLE